MKFHLAVCRSVSGDDHNRYGSFVSEVQRSGGVEDWTATRKLSVGDLVLFYFGAPVKSIVAVGFVASEIRTEKGDFDWTNRKKVTFCDFAPIWLLTKQAPLDEACDASGLKAWYKTKPYRNSRELKEDIAWKLLCEIEDSNPDIRNRLSKFNIQVSGHRKSAVKRPTSSLKQFSEGGVREMTVELQNRNPQLRAQAIAVYGETCRVCGFNFEEFYRELGAGYIEVHHLKPLSESLSENSFSSGSQASRRSWMRIIAIKIQASALVSVFS
jgi:hypothetical protein